MFTYLPFGPFESESDFQDLIETRVEPNPGYILFSVWDKTTVSTARIPTVAEVKDGALAGIIGLLNASADALATEIGFVMILPPFHRTHVASNATGLLLHYALEINPYSFPAEQESPADIFKLTNGHPLGLRRVFWQTNAHNVASKRLAERMGFKFEATLRWDRLLAAEKPGNGVSVRNSDPKPHFVGRTTDMLSLCWDDWEGEVRERVQQIMMRIQ
jgi:RimJ/RimL family protein N-acetyltransferase